ncbi:MAG: hypothetical protein NC225_08180 [Clostridium sp.]|nr:hypothetical protein [Clostridium sp.]MCM1399440.1 hypothetical protein [Clostridium sp.]MCM1459994.1 hypothetical protein [Bacteroides sp.]
MEHNIIIETLYPEFANLFGDLMNTGYLKKCMPDAVFADTHLFDEPAFVSQDVSMVFMGAMSEKQQELVVSALLPYKDRIMELIDKGCIFLMTGNAMEIFGQYIEDEDNSQIQCLGLFDLYAKRYMFNRHNSYILGEFEDMKVLGFKSQFSHSYGDNTDCYFYKVTKGCGINPESSLEGIRKNNFYGTYTIGPFLVSNPLFVKYLMSIMGIEHPKLAFEDTIMSAYNSRLLQFETFKPSH